MNFFEQRRVSLRVLSISLKIERWREAADESMTEMLDRGGQTEL